MNDFSAAGYEHGTSDFVVGIDREVEFVISQDKLFILDAVPAERSARAAVRIAVDLARRNVITKERALLRVEPMSLVEHLHPQIDRDALRDVFATGLPASPGAATGRVVFTAQFRSSDKAPPISGGSVRGAPTMA